MRFVSINRVLSLLIALPAMLLMSACGNNRSYSKDSFATDSPYQKQVKTDAEAACLGARRALLGDGYIIDNASTADNVKGRKAYRADSDRSTFVEMSIVCLPDPAGSTLYANGVLSTYDVKKSASAASVGVSAIGSVSLPIGQSADSMVKTSDETITDRDFYRKFFGAVEYVLFGTRPETTAPGAKKGPDASVPKAPTTPAVPAPKP